MDYLSFVTVLVFLGGGFWNGFTCGGKSGKMVVGWLPEGLVLYSTFWCGIPWVGGWWHGSGVTVDEEERGSTGRTSA